MDSLNIGTVIVGHELSRYANWKESSCTDVGKFCMVSALPREVDRSKHHSVYRGERDWVDAYARPRWWCCSPHQLTLLLPLFNHQFSGASNQLRIKHLSSVFEPRFTNKIYLVFVCWPKITRFQCEHRTCLRFCGWSKFT